MINFMGWKDSQLLVGRRAMGQLCPAWQAPGGGTSVKRSDTVPTEDITQRQARIVLILLILLGLVLRSVSIGREALWADEALTAVLVRYPWWSFAVTSIDPSPPLFYWLEKLLVPDGAGAVAWRMVSLVAGVVTIALAYWLGRELSSRGGGLVTAGLVAASAPLVDYSQEARAYALAVAMIAGSAAALAAVTGGRLAGDKQRSARRRMLAVFVMFTIFAIFSHFIALLWVLPALVALRLATEPTWRKIEPREMLATGLAVALFLAIEFRRLVIYQFEQNGFSWLEQMSPARIVRTLGEQWLPFANIIGWPAALAGAALLMGLLWWTRKALVAWGQARPLQAMIVAALLFEPLGLWLIGLIAPPVAMPRTFLPAGLGFAALVGIAIASLSRRLAVVVGAAVTGLSLASLLIAGTVRPKEQWAVAGQVTMGAPVVINCANWKTPAFLAAAKGPGLGLVITSSGNKALAVHQPGDSASWDRLYFERVQRVGHSPLRHGRPAMIERRPIRIKQLLFVASECSATERHAFAEWADLRASKLLWSSSAVGDVAAIQVEEWQLGGTRPLDLWIVH